MITSSHDRISPTAKFVAHLRTFTDIPFSERIAVACGAKEVFCQIVGDRANDLPWIAPIIEMRYKSVDVLLRQYGYTSILELAAGVSPRGLIWTENPGITYLLTDLPEILAESKSILMGILDGQPRKSLSWLPMNVLNEVDFVAAENFFGTKSIAVINEGLLPYLNREEKAQVAGNIRRLLTKHGGVWITPDVLSSDRIKAVLERDPTLAKLLEAFYGFTGQNLESNSFATLEEAEQFFIEIGFRVRKYNQHELVPCLSSLDKTNTDPTKIKGMLERGRVWAMEVE